MGLAEAQEKWLIGAWKTWRGPVTVVEDDCTIVRGVSLGPSTGSRSVEVEIAGVVRTIPIRQARPASP